MTEKTRKISLAGVAATAVLIAAPTLAIASLNKGDAVGTSIQDIAAKLSAEGYVIHEIEAEGGDFEAEVVLNGMKLELEIDGKTGKITEVEKYDGDDDDDDDDDYRKDKDDD